MTSAEQMGELRIRVRELETVLGEITAVLGRYPRPGCPGCCEGCRGEMAEVLRIAAEAVGGA